MVWGFSLLDFETLEKKYKNINESDLVETAKTGDLLAQEYLIRKYMGFVKMKSRTYFLAGGSKEDIIQEGMIGIFKAINDYDKTKNDSFAPFVNMCVTRQIITAIKKATRKKHKPLNSSVSLSEPFYDEVASIALVDVLRERKKNNPEELIISNERLNMIEETIGSVLSKFELKVLLMHLQEKSYKIISNELGKEIKSVDNALQRIKKKLDKHLNII
jgi:RNA polymerase sporulation-specific sigma factor